MSASDSGKLATSEELVVGPVPVESSVSKGVEYTFVCPRGIDLNALDEEYQKVKAEVIQSDPEREKIHMATNTSEKGTGLGRFIIRIYATEITTDEEAKALNDRCKEISEKLKPILMRLAEEFKSKQKAAVGVYRDGSTQLTLPEALSKITPETQGAPTGQAAQKPTVKR